MLSALEIPCIEHCRDNEQHACDQQGSKTPADTRAVGSDADIVVWDPRQRCHITAAAQAQRVDYNAYEGIEQQGRVREVFLRGLHAVQAGRIATGPTGRYLMRKKRQQGEDASCTNSR